jgi:SAM-dependent methyltransferase
MDRQFACPLGHTSGDLRARVRPVPNPIVARIQRRIGSIQPFNSSRWYLNEWAKAAGRVGHGKDFKVLDAGAGAAPYRKHFGQVTYETADFAEVDKEYGQLDYVCGLDRLPMPDATYDMVFCSQVLEHIPEPAAVLREIHRVLKPGGQAWLSAPLFYEEHEKPYDFYRYTQFAWRKLAEDAGFAVESLDWMEGYYGTLSYQLKMASKELSLRWAPLRLVFLGLAELFGRLDVKHKVTSAGMPKNYRCVLRA